MHGLKCGSCRIWQRTDLPPDSNMLRAEIQRALWRAPRKLRRLARLANSPGFKSFRCSRWRIKFSLERFSDPSRYSLRAQPLESSLGRVPQAADLICARTSNNRLVSVAEDCLSPERTFHGCPLMFFRGCIGNCIRGSIRDSISVVLAVCVPSRWKVLSGEFRRRPTEFVIEHQITGSCRSPRTV